jgi:hypothetical protein
MHDAASADAEHDAAAGDVLQCRELLGGPRGIAQGEHHQADADVDALGAAATGREHDHALRIGAGRLEVVAHKDAVEAELLRGSGLFARARRRSVGAGLQHHRDVQPAAHRTTSRVLPRVVRASITGCASLARSSGNVCGRKLA